MLFLLLALLLFFAVAAGRFYYLCDHVKWERDQETTLLRRQLDQVQTRASGLEERVDLRIMEIGAIDDQLKAAEQRSATIEDELQRAGDALQATKEQLRFWMSKAEHVNELYEKANADAIEAREIIADWVAQRTFGRTIFHKAPPLPEESRHKRPIPRARIQGRLAVQLADAQFAKAERDFKQRQAAPDQPETEPEASE